MFQKKKTNKAILYFSLSILSVQMFVIKSDVNLSLVYVHHVTPKKEDERTTKF